MENTLKIKVFRKSILFCKYLRNGSSDLYLYVVVNYYLVSLSFKFHEDLDTNARARVVNARTRDKTRVRARLCTDLYEKFFGSQKFDMIVYTQFCV